MINRDINIIAMHRRLKFRQKLQAKCISRVTDCCGICEGLLLHTKRGYINDVFYFGLSKACRTLMACRELYDLGYHEDSIILIRSAYESYLFLSFALEADSNEVVEYLLKNPIGLSFKIYKKKKGIVVDLRSGVETTYKDTPPSFFVKGTGHKLDLEIHSQLYKFLCEYTHPNMATSGSYRDQIVPYRFFCQPHCSINPLTLFLAVYVSNLLLGEIFSFEDLDPPELMAVKRQIFGGVEDICHYLDSFAPSENTKLMQKIKKRSVAVLNYYLKFTPQSPSAKEKKRIEQIV